MLFRNLFFFAVMLAGAVVCAQGTLTNRIYGDLEGKFSYASPEKVEVLGDRHVIIGERRGSDTDSRDIYFWYFDPDTGEITDSMALTLPGYQTVVSTYPGPDGGVLLVYNTSLERLINFAYFNRSGDLKWSASVPAIDINVYAREISAVTFVDAENLIVALSYYGSRDRWIQLDSSGNVREMRFEFGECARLKSIEVLPDNRLLVGGDNFCRLGPSEPFLATTTMAGDTVWYERLVYSSVSPSAYKYGHMKGVHRPPGDTIIVTTGIGRSDDERIRYVAIFDTTGQVLEEYSMPETLTEIFGEKTKWGNGDYLFAERTQGGASTFIELDNFRPVSEPLMLRDNVGEFGFRGSYYDDQRNMIFSGLNSSLGPVGANGLLHSLDVESGDVRLTHFGSIGSEGQDKALDLYSDEQGNLTIVGVLATLGSKVQPALIKLDANYDELTRIPLEDPVLSFGIQQVIATDNGDVLFLRRELDLEQPRRIYIKQYSTNGTLVLADTLRESMLNRSHKLSATTLNTGELVILNYNNPISIRNFRGADLLLQVQSDTGWRQLDIPIPTSTNNKKGIITDAAGQVILYSSDIRGDTSRLHSIDPETGSVNWEFSTSRDFGSGTSQIAAIDIRNDGSIAALLIEQRPNFIPDKVYYLLVSATGEEISRKEIFSGKLDPHGSTYSLSHQNDTTARIVFNSENVSSPDPSDVIWYAMRYNTASEELIYTTQFPVEDIRKKIYGVELLPNGEIAILSDAFRDSEVQHTDIFLWLFNDDKLVSVFDEPLPNHKVSVFPNPTSDKINIKLNEPFTSKLTVTVANALGQQLSQQTIPPGSTQLQLGLHTQSDGIYFILVTDDRGRGLTRRVVLQR